MYHPPDGHNAGRGSSDPGYVVIVGNMSRIVGPFPTKVEANLHVEHLATLPRWSGYSFTVARLDAPDSTSPVISTAERA